MASRASASRWMPICRKYPASPMGASAGSGGGGTHWPSVSAARCAAAACVRSGLSSHSRRRLRMPSVGATISGVSAPSAAMVGSAPRASSAATTSRLSWKTARQRGVRPCVF
eukprot:scaffold240744_cov24-Tisochrysis_lutea.AAC.1